MSDLVASCDYAIIGAGIAGASAAFHLASQGKKVLIVEAEGVAGYHTTGRSAALYALDQGDPIVVSLSVASRRFLEMPPAGFADAPIATPRGALYLARRNDEHRLANIVARQAQLMTVDQACGLVPLLRPESFTMAAFDRDVLDLDVHALHQGFLRGALKAGAQILYDARVLCCERQDGRWLIATPAGRIGTRIIVNAAGAWADELATLAGARPIGIQPRRRTAVVLDVPNGVRVDDWPAVSGVDGSFYFKPETGRLMASPSDATDCAPHDVQPEEYDVAVCIDRVQNHLAIDVHRPSTKWAGLRSFAPDGRPVIGYDPEAPDFFWLAGQGGTGIQTAPAVAALAAELAIGGSAQAMFERIGIVAADIAPARFAEGLNDRSLSSMAQHSA